jgi:glucose/mannose transport system permease protein
MSRDIVDLITSKQDVRNKKRKLTGKERFWLIFRYVSLIFIWFLVVMPIYVMVINSLKGVKNVYLTNAFKLPEKLDFSAWDVAWNGADYFPQSISDSMTRTLIFVVQSSIISAILGSINGFVFAKWKFKRIQLHLHSIPIWNVYSISSNYDSVGKNCYHA